MPKRLVFGRLAADLKQLDLLGLVSVRDLHTKNLDEQNVPNHFHPTPGASGATADEHQHQQRSSAKVVPLIKIGGTVAGGRDDRYDLKQAVAKTRLGVGKICIAMAETKQDNRHSHNSDHPDISPKLKVLKQRHRITGNHKIQKRKICARQNHKQDHNVFDRPPVLPVLDEMSEAGVVGAKASSGHRPKRMANGIEYRHPKKHQDHGQHKVKPDVHRREQPSRMLHPRIGIVLRRAGHLCSHQSFACRALTQ